MSLRHWLIITLEDKDHIHQILLEIINNLNKNLLEERGPHFVVKEKIQVIENYSITTQLKEWSQV
jgi:hypothetical protein